MNRPPLNLAYSVFHEVENRSDESAASASAAVIEVQRHCPETVTAAATGTADLAHRERPRHSLASRYAEPGNRWCSPHHRERSRIRPLTSATFARGRPRHRALRSTPFVCSRARVGGCATPTGLLMARNMPDSGILIRLDPRWDQLLRQLCAWNHAGDRRLHRAGPRARTRPTRPVPGRRTGRSCQVRNLRRTGAIRDC